jgi:hypothetical protein
MEKELPEALKETAQNDIYKYYLIIDDYLLSISAIDCVSAVLKGLLTNSGSYSTRVRLTTSLWRVAA